LRFFQRQNLLDPRRGSSRSAKVRSAEKRRLFNLVKGGKEGHQDIDQRKEKTRKACGEGTGGIPFAFFSLRSTLNENASGRKREITTTRKYILVRAKL